MSDLIDRQAAIDAFDCTNELIVGGEANAQNVVNYINKVVGKIKDLPSAQPDDEETNYWHEKANSYEQTLVKLSQNIQPEIIRCKDCRWWDKSDDSPYGYCMAMKHGFMSANWEIGIYRRYKGDFYCADAERRTDEAD